MSEGDERPVEPCTPLPPASASGHKPTPDPKTNGPKANDSASDVRTFIEQLKQGLEKTRLPADVRDQILANLPPAEEREKLFREMLETGGLSSEEFIRSLGLDVEPHP
jgi:hypothetical protein